MARNRDYRPMPDAPEKPDVREVPDVPVLEPEPSFESVVFTRHIEENSSYGREYLDQVKAHPSIDNGRFAEAYAGALAQQYEGSAKTYEELVLNYLNS